MKGSKKRKQVMRRRSAEERGDRDEHETMPARGQRWWCCEGETCAAALWAWFGSLRATWSNGALIDLVHKAIYEARPLGATSDTLAADQLIRSASAPASINITKSMVDTATSKIAKRRPYPAISADDAGWSEKLFAKRATRVLRRKLSLPRVERLKPKIVRDGLLWGTGVVKVIRRGGDVDLERVPRRELVVDPREARYGEPRTMAHVRPVPREVLCDMFPDSHEAIMAAPVYDRSDLASRYAYDGSGYADHVEVIEAWHLPSGPEAEDGRRVIAIRGTVLDTCEWERPRFPFALFHWSEPVDGMWGQGLVETMSGIQAKTNDMVRDTQTAIYYGSMLKVFAQRSSNVNKHHMRARHPVVIEHDGAAPQYVAPNPVSPVVIQFIDWLIDKASQMAGISQLSQSAKNPLGSNASGKAIDTMYDIESDRHSMVELALAMFMCDVGTLMIDEARALADDVREGESDVKLAAWIEEIDWSKVDLDGGDYHLGVEPVNFMPDSRGGKLSFVAELSKAGLIPDPTMTAALFDEPDITRANRSNLGPYRNLERIMEGLADESVPMLDLVPDDYMNVPLGILMAKGELNDAASTGAPESVLDRYRQWIDQAKALPGSGAPDPNASPSLQGMPASPNMPAPSTAASLQPGLGAGGPPMPPPGMPAPGMING